MENKDAYIKKHVAAMTAQMISFVKSKATWRISPNANFTLIEVIRTAKQFNISDAELLSQMKTIHAAVLGVVFEELLAANDPIDEIAEVLAKIADAMSGSRNYKEYFHRFKEGLRVGQNHTAVILPFVRSKKQRIGTSACLVGY